MTILYFYIMANIEMFGNYIIQELGQSLEVVDIENIKKLTKI